MTASPAVVKRHYQVSGEVQRVGYRDIVAKIARRAGVSGTVRNLPDGTVEVVCEGEPARLDSFVAAIDIRQELIQVEAVRLVSEEPLEMPEGSFRLLTGPLEEEFQDRAVSVLNYLSETNRSIQKVGEKVDVVGEKVDAVGRKVDGVQGSVDGVGQKVDLLRSETSQRFDRLDDRYGQIGTVAVELLDEVRGLRSDLRSRPENRS